MYACENFIAPVFLGSGIRLFDGIEKGKYDIQIIELIPSKPDHILETQANKAINTEQLPLNGVIRTMVVCPHRSSWLDHIFKRIFQSICFKVLNIPNAYITGSPIRVLNCIAYNQIRTALGSRYPSSPYTPYSLPIPDCFEPPNGANGS